MKNKKLLSISIIFLLITTIFGFSPAISADNGDKGQSSMNEEFFNLTIINDCRFHPIGSGGTVSPEPGVYTYPAGTEVEMILNANPNEGWVFHHWGAWAHNLPGESYYLESYEKNIRIDITMDRDHKYRAFFRKPPTVNAYCSYKDANSLILKGGLENDGDGDNNYFSCCYVKFRYRQKGTYTWEYLTDNWVGKNSAGSCYSDNPSNNNFQQILGGLTDGETYEFQAGATNTEFDNQDDIVAGWSDIVEKKMNVDLVKPEVPTIVAFHKMNNQDKFSNEITVPQYSILKYQATSTHSLNCPIKYGWDWNNNNVVDDDEWQTKRYSYFDSGESAYQTDFIDNEPGEFTVKVKAATVKAESDWAELTVIVTGDNQRPTINSNDCKYKQNGNKLTVKATDPDNDNVYYFICPESILFDGKTYEEKMKYIGYIKTDDNDNSLFPQGITQEFIEPGDPSSTFYVRAIDENGSASDWNEISYFKTKGKQSINALRNFFENHPKLLHIINHIIEKFNLIN